MAAALQRDLDASIARGAERFTIPAGDYYFGSTPCRIAQATNMLVDGAGAHLWFDIGGGVLISNSSNVTVTNVTIDYERLPYLQVSALADARRLPSGAYEVNVSTDVGSMDPDKFWERFSKDKANEFVQGPQWWAPGHDGLFAAPPYMQAFRSFNATRQIRRRSGSTSSSNEFTFTSDVASAKGRPLPHALDKMSVIVRKGITLHTHNSSRCRFLDVRIHSASYMAVTEYDGVGGHSYERITVGRRPNLRSATERCGKPDKPRLCLAVVSSNADVFHSSGCRDGPHLRRVSFSYAMDDYLNVHSRAQVVAARLSNHSLLIIDPRLARDDAVADDSPYGTAETLPHVRGGDVFTFHVVSTLAQVARATVASTRSTTDASHVAIAKGARAVINGPHCGAKPPLNPISFLPSATSPNRLWVVEFTAPLADAISPCTLANLESWPNAGAVVEDSHFFGGIDGLRWKSSNGRISNNLWENALSNSATGLEVTPLQSYLEGPLAIANVSISGNTFTRVKPADAGRLISNCTGMAHRGRFTACTNVTATNNTFRPT